MLPRKSYVRPRLGSLCRAVLRAAAPNGAARGTTLVSSPVLPRSGLVCYKRAARSTVGVSRSTAVVEVGRRRIVVEVSRSAAAVEVGRRRIVVEHRRSTVVVGNSCCDSISTS